MQNTSHYTESTQNSVWFTVTANEVLPAIVTTVYHDERSALTIITPSITAGLQAVLLWANTCSIVSSVKWCYNLFLPFLFPFFLPICECWAQKAKSPIQKHLIIHEHGPLWPTVCTAQMALQRGEDKVSWGWRPYASPSTHKQCRKIADLPLSLENPSAGLMLYDTGCGTRGQACSLLPLCDRASGSQQRE